MWYIIGMTKQEYWDHISFLNTPRRAMLKRTIEEYGGYKKLSELTDVSAAILRSCINREVIPSTLTIAKLCGFLRVHPSEIVHLYGFEIVDRYWEKKAKLKNRFTGHVTYQPLRELLYDRYGEKEWKKYFNKMCDLIPTPISEKQRKVKEKWLEENGLEQTNPGLSATMRAALINDRPVSLAIIYNICELLHCPIDCVMGYK